MDLTLKVWRQKNREDKGKLESYKVSNISENSSFLEMMDVLNEQLITEGKAYFVAFDHDCRERAFVHVFFIYKWCLWSRYRKVTTCQLHMYV